MAKGWGIVRISTPLKPKIYQNTPKNVPIFKLNKNYSQKLISDVTLQKPIFIKIFHQH